MTDTRTTATDESDTNNPASNKTTDRIDWSVPKNPWNDFQDHLSQNRTSVRAYERPELERAMIEYTDLDNSPESTIDRLVRAAGRRPKDIEDSEPVTSDSLANEDRVRVQKVVDADIANGFRAKVEQSDDTYGVELGRALRKYLEDDRQSRLNRKLDRIADDAEGLLSTLADSNSDGLSSVERTTITIVNELPDVFDGETLEKAICKHAGRSDSPAKQTVEEYRERVINHLDDDVKRYDDEDGTTEYLPPKVWRQKIVGDVIDALGGDRSLNTAPAFDRADACRALDANGIEVSENNREQVNAFVEQLIDRLGFEYDGDTDEFRDPEDVNDTSDPVEESESEPETADSEDTHQNSDDLESNTEPETPIEETRWFSEVVESIVDADRNLVALWESMDIEYARESIADQITDAQPDATAGSVAPEEIDAVADEIGLTLEECTEIARTDNGRQVATDGGVVSE